MTINLGIILFVFAFGLFIGEFILTEFEYALDWPWYKHVPASIFLGLFLIAAFVLTAFGLGWLVAIEVTL